MQIVYTEQARRSMDDAMEFWSKKYSEDQIEALKKAIIIAISDLEHNPFLGQLEPQLQSLNLGHRRIIVGHTKVIYRIIGAKIYVLDIFDSRQDPNKMKD